MRTTKLITTKHWPRSRPTTLTVFWGPGGQACVGASKLAFALECHVSDLPQHTVYDKPEWLTDNRVSDVVFLSDAAVECVEHILGSKKNWDADKTAEIIAQLDIVKHVEEEEEEEEEDNDLKREIVEAVVAEIKKPRTFAPLLQEIKESIKEAMDHRTQSAALYAYLESEEGKRRMEQETQEARRHAADMYELEFQKLLKERRPAMEAEVDAVLREQLMKERQPVVQQQLVRECINNTVANVGAQTEKAVRSAAQDDFARITTRRTNQKE